MLMMLKVDKSCCCDDFYMCSNSINRYRKVGAVVGTNVFKLTLIFFQFVLTEMYYDGFHRSFCDDDDDLDIIQESDSIFAFETPETFKLENIRTKRGRPSFSLSHFSTS